MRAVKLPRATSSLASYKRVVYARRTPPVRRLLRLSAADGAATLTDNPISLTENSLSHLKKLRQEAGGSNMLLRVGVKQGGCSGMSYIMDFEQEGNVQPDDYIMQYDDGQVKLVCNPKSLLYLFGMRLDYSDALIGGGFQFSNPNAVDTCGCGKSFGV